MLIYLVIAIVLQAILFTTFNLGQNENGNDIFGYVFEVLINGIKQYSNNVDNHFSMEFSNVAFYASRPLFDTFDFHYGKVWKMKVNEEEVIRGN